MEKSIKINLNAKALAAISELCQEDTLEANISLMEDSIDMFLSDKFPEDSGQIVDFVRAYRALSKNLQTILENVRT